MKIYVILLAVISLFQDLSAQCTHTIYRKDLPDIFISYDISLHIVSPEPITYVDISTPGLAGDIPNSNILRLKIIPDSVANYTDFLGVVTIVGESFMAQYNLCYASKLSQNIASQVEIIPEHTRSLDVAGISMTTPDMKMYALSMLKNLGRSAIEKEEAFGISARLNHLYTAGDYIFLDLSFKNETNIVYDIDELRFKIEDRKINKATNVQSIEIKPVWQLYPLSGFQKTFRNIYVIKKATFPGNKVLNISLAEKQISGRTLTLKVSYKDVLKADTF